MKRWKRLVVVTPRGRRVFRVRPDLIMEQVCRCIEAGIKDDRMYVEVAGRGGK